MPFIYSSAFPSPNLARSGPGIARSSSSSGRVGRIFPRSRSCMSRRSGGLCVRTGPSARRGPPGRKPPSETRRSGAKPEGSGRTSTGKSGPTDPARSPRSDALRPARRPSVPRTRGVACGCISKRKAGAELYASRKSRNQSLPRT